jgi:hypothetical protein
MRSHNSSGTSQIVGSGFFFFITPYPLLAYKLYAFRGF